MKACSKSDAGAFIAGGITVVLGVFFWLPTGRGTVSLMPSVSLEGKSWVLHAAEPPRPPAASEAKSSEDRGSAPAKLPTAKRKVPAWRARKSAAAATPTAPKDSPIAGEQTPKQNQPVAVAAVVPPGTLDPIQQYSTQELIDGFESDLARYPLDKTVRAEGVALSLEGIQRREKLFVLKVSVANGADADFFIKDFSVRAGSTVLGSRSLFRILVEPQRVREGYVVFEKPQAGAAVQIKLKEDGGKGRVVETSIPYRF